MSKKTIIILSVIFLVVVLLFVFMFRRVAVNAPVTPGSGSTTTTTTNSSGFGKSTFGFPTSTSSQPETKDYASSTLGFQTKMPTNFFPNTDWDIKNGTYASSEVFSTKQGYAPTLNSSDVSLSITVSHADEKAPGVKSLGDIKKHLMKVYLDAKRYKLSPIKSMTVANFPAIQYKEEVLPSKSSVAGCYYLTYFQQDSKIHSIVMEANSCGVLDKYKGAYDSIVNNFQFTN